jgi:hypothetical protein
MMFILDRTQTLACSFRCRMKVSKCNNLNRKTKSMLYSAFSDEEIARRGKEIYETQIRAQIETTENIGKIISIDIKSGDYEIDNDLLTTCHRLQARHNNPVLWTERIGFNAVYAIGGTLTRTA